MVSDLHLGDRLGHDVLRRPEALERLLGALDGVQRLVLLGDVLELYGGHQQRALEAARPVLRAIGARLGRERELVLVPGNHDALLVHAWVRARAPRLALDATVEPYATPLLERVTSWLRPARVEVRYPGVWLTPRVWATHGHYLDRHLLPESAFGLARGLLGRLPRDGAVPIDYELAGGPSLTRLEALLTRWLPRPLATAVENTVGLARAATMPKLPAHLLPSEIAPLTATVLGARIRRASIPAMARVVHRLGGPNGSSSATFTGLDRCPATVRWIGSDPVTAQDGQQRLLALRATARHGASPPHPHWPGGALLLEDDLDPRPLSLLDDLAPGVLR